MRSATMRSTIESGTSSPRAMIGCARCPSEVPCETCSRSMSPVERCGAAKRRANSFAWVPFPAPGGPRKITARSSVSCGRMSEVTQSSPSDYVCRTLAPAADPAFPCKSFVIAHDQLRFQLLDGIHRDTDNDQQRCTAEIKVHAQTVQNPLGENAVKPVAAKPDRQVIEVNARDHPLRKKANQRQIHGADQGQALQDTADVLAGIASGTNTGNEAAVLAHIVGEFGGIEDDTHIEKRKQQDHR